MHFKGWRTSFDETILLPNTEQSYRAYQGSRGRSPHRVHEKARRHFWRASGPWTV